MLQYYALLIQDVVELNFLTVKRAHAAVLQEIEKGKLNWDKLEEIEKTKNRYTQRLVQNQRVGGFATIQTCTHFNKGFCRMENDHVANGVLYEHCCSFCLKETDKKFDHPLTKCLRIKNGQTTKNEVTSIPKKEQKV